jgi:hypothetical protein
MQDVLDSKETSMELLGEMRDKNRPPSEARVAVGAN